MIRKDLFFISFILSLFAIALTVLVFEAMSKSSIIKNRTESKNINIRLDVETIKSYARAGFAMNTISTFFIFSYAHSSERLDSNIEPSDEVKSEKKEGSINYNSSRSNK